jgi:hypothetical protein
MVHYDKPKLSRTEHMSSAVLASRQIYKFRPVYPDLVSFPGDWRKSWTIQQLADLGGTSIAKIHQLIAVSVI